jgi:hypothetical protein
VDTIGQRVVEQLGMPTALRSCRRDCGADGNAEEEYAAGRISPIPGFRAIARGNCSGIRTIRLSPESVRIGCVLRHRYDHCPGGHSAGLPLGALADFYLVMMIVTPAAKTPYEKCLMHGLKPTAENMAKFSSNK